MASDEAQGWRYPWSGSGLFTGAVAWATHQQAGNLLTESMCQGGGRPIFLAVSVVAVVVTLAGLFLSARDLRATWNGPDNVREVRRARFIAGMACGSAGIFLLAIVAQTLAALILTGCER
jgi:hypothetical protein